MTIENFHEKNKNFTLVGTEQLKVNQKDGIGDEWGCDVDPDDPRFWSKGEIKRNADRDLNIYTSLGG